MSDLVDQILSHLKAIWHYKWYAIVIAWTIALAGWIAVYQIPDRYKVSARVFLENQSMLTPLLKGITVMPDLAQITTLVTKDFLTRQNFVEVVRRVELEAGQKTDEERAELMAKLYSNSSIGLANRRGVYWISFVDEDPQLAKQVVKVMLDLFVERSLGKNREDSVSARRFIDEQLESYRDKLVASEDAIIAFKRRHMGILPGAGPNYFAKLERAKEAVRTAELSLKEAENSADSIKEQIAIASRKASLSDDGASVDGAVKPESEIDIRIRTQQAKLDDLRLRYTEQHPDIVAIVDMVANLKEQKALEEAEAKLFREQLEREAMLRGDPPTTALQATDPVYQQLTVSLAKAEASAAAMRARSIETKRRYAELLAAANAVPQVEAEFTQLTRDYNVNKAYYADLLKRRDKAQISDDMETDAGAMGFRVIAHPYAPRRPSEPDRVRLMTLVLLAALAGGIGTAWGIGQMRPTINDERTLREASELPVLGTIVMSWTDVQLKRRKWGLIAFLTSFASLLSAYGALMAVLLLAVSRA